MLTTCGARPTTDGTHFAVWAPKAERVEVVIYQSEDACEEHSTVHTLSKTDGGIFRTLVGEARAGSLYKFKVDGKGPFPDPVSRFQPKGVHGPSQVVDLARFQWTDGAWRGLDSMDRLVVYEARAARSVAPAHPRPPAPRRHLLREGKLRRRRGEAPLPEGSRACSHRSGPLTLP